VLQTGLTKLLRAQYPILLAPMAGGPTTPELVVAVSQAGGFGTLAGAALALNDLEQAIAAVQAATDAPFGVNFQLVEPGAGGDLEAVQEAIDPFRVELGLPPGPRQLEVVEVSVDDQVELCLTRGVPVLTFALGDPSRFFGQGALVGSMVTTVEEAAHVEAAGADFVIAQGTEAGGHRSTFDVSGDVPLVGTMALVPQVVDAVDVPVVATGGIVDGRGVAAALALGADGAQLGTRFLLAREAATAPGYRAALLHAVETDTVVTTSFTGRPARSIRNRFVEETAGVEPLPWPRQRAAASDLYRAALERGASDLHPLLAGQGLRGLRDGQPAAEIVGEVVEQAEAVLRALASASPSS
jgi:nitronate monooxygenase